MKDKKIYLLCFLIILSSFLFSVLGNHWNAQYYHNSENYSPTAPPLATAMRGLHDKLYLAEYLSFSADYAVCNLSVSEITEHKLQTGILSSADSSTSLYGASIADEAAQSSLPSSSESYDFTTASDDYFSDACFIGDSRTVGISEYAGIEGATFLCKTSLSIYDYDKPKITYNNHKTSVREVLTQNQFGKIYLMLGINECGIGTPEYFYECYNDVINDIRALQPDALIFIQGNLLVTKAKSDESDTITNANLTARNKLIATLANQKDIFYIDINDSILCKEGALVPDYTWDQVHIKAQYYPVWKEFLLQHAIVRN